ncbi:MAG: two-component system, NtrC family, response regulator PilR [Candidatus Magnetoglobus multicellularis str. Araruama]|uniref:Two-component system, NtrC family, response regulator PilR n=1 Tax=Candidatus Magnetoglobus multicellularis str. Araruama TaxID=890399 RepID=A0A1V1P9W5_9BACT|nr:MAG: two-component system, NtrC family, response regulator PilR [Candidatus Magnetoglobus multicellularis str. Araruama]
MSTILIVDDDNDMREFLEIMLADEGYDVTCAAEAKQALGFCKKIKFDLIITDLRMPKIDGIEFIKRVKEILPETPVVLITGYASPDSAYAAMQEGAIDYVEKNFEVEDFKQLVREALAKKGAREEHADFIRDIEDAVRFGKIIGKSKAMLKVYGLIKKVAQTTTNVLIVGESGTGKELVAEAIHENSQRRDKPFVTINCGGIPETLLESELFGYMKGSFSGAYSDKPGLFEVAHGGSIFLDEIGELPISLQVKLLRVIQTKIIRRVGGSRDIKVDIRIISATNQDLREKSKNKTFREDLFYRLNVIPIHMPPLRKRKQDIPILTQFFFEKYSKKFGKKINKISNYAIELLMKHRFPGNVRELENIIERSVALETSNIVLPENMIISDEDTSDWDRMMDAPFPDEGLNLNEQLATFERGFIKKALEKANGSRTKAAELLQISVDSLRYRLEKLDLR